MTISPSRDIAVHDSARIYLRRDQRSQAKCHGVASPRKHNGGSSWSALPWLMSVEFSSCLTICHPGPHRSLRFWRRRAISGQKPAARAPAPITDMWPTLATPLRRTS